MSPHRPSRRAVLIAAIKTYPDQVKMVLVMCVCLIALVLGFSASFGWVRDAPEPRISGTVLGRSQPLGIVPPVVDRWRIALPGRRDPILARGQSLSTEIEVGSVVCMRHLLSGLGPMTSSQFYVLHTGPCPS